MTDDVKAALPHCQHGFVARDLCLTCTMMDDYETALNIVSEQRNKLIEEAQERERYIERWSAETQTTIANRDAEIEKWRELQRAVAAMIEADPETWPSHGNAPLAIASAFALRKATIDRLRAELAEALGVDVASLDA